MPRTRVLPLGRWPHLPPGMAADAEFEPFDAVLFAGLSRHIDLLPGVAAADRRLTCHRRSLQKSPAASRSTWCGWWSWGRSWVVFFYDFANYVAQIGRYAGSLFAPFKEAAPMAGTKARQVLADRANPLPSCPTDPA